MVAGYYAEAGIQAGLQLQKSALSQKKLIVVACLSKVAGEDQIKALALASKKVQAAMNGKESKKIIFDWIFSTVSIQQKYQSPPSNTAKKTSFL